LLTHGRTAVTNASSSHPLTAAAYPSHPTPGGTPYQVGPHLDQAHLRAR
jgi:hypothetical protein